jgi:two-component system sensor histidine kinase QseC
MRRYLVMILLSVITLVTFFAAIDGYKASMQKASDLFDAELASLAETLIVITPQQTLTQVNSEADIAFQLFEADKLLLRTSNAPTTTMVRQVNGGWASGFGESNFLGQRWRTFIKTIDYNHKVVIVAQPLQRRFELAEEVILSAVTPIIVVIPLLMLLISFTIRQGLKPLTHLTEELMSKKANDLSLLQTTTQTKELMPVITTLNQLFERLSGAFERERHFASDAAHELRTPLSVLKINVHNLQNELHDTDSPFSDKQLPQLQQLEHSVDRMAHVVDQILNLNRTNPQQITYSAEPVDLTAQLQQTISDLYPQIAQREQHISLQSEGATIKGNEFALGILCQNLIGNASKYTPDDGQISVFTEVVDEYLTLIVEDSGPGIEPQEYQRVFDRFYRVGGDRHHSSVIGCGLGLAIVKHIVELHEAVITLSPSASLGGLKVSVSFANTLQSVDKHLKGPLDA